MLKYEEIKDEPPMFKVTKRARKHTEFQIYFQRSIGKIKKLKDMLADPATNKKSIR